MGNREPAIYRCVTCDELCVCTVEKPTKLGPCRRCGVMRPLLGPPITASDAGRAHCPVCQYEAEADRVGARCPNGPPLRLGGTPCMPGPRTRPFDFYAHDQEGG